MTTIARPTNSDQAVVAEVAKLIAPEIVQWCVDYGDTPDVADVEEHCRKIIGKALDYDGFALAEDFKGVGYWPDADLVGILDGTRSLLYQAVKRAESAWVVEHGLTGPEIGATVSFVSQRYPRIDSIGEVTRNWPDGHSTVFCEDLGHVRQGNGRRGEIVAWENLTVVEGADK